MAHFKLENDISNSVVLDAPLTRGPPPRWRRKALEMAATTASMSNLSLNQSACKTPNHAANTSDVSGKTPSKTPSKPLGKSKATPKKSKTPKTPGGADRFIPSRNNKQFDVANFKILQEKQQNLDEVQESISSNEEYKRAVCEAINGADICNAKILCYSHKAPPAPEGHLNNLRVLYCQDKTPSSAKKTRHIRTAPERILDAPELVDDYYLNLMDWGTSNHLAIALGRYVYLWNAGSGEIQELYEMDGEGEYVSSLSWIPDNSGYLAMGTSSGEVQIWDAERCKRVRVMYGHTARVGCLSWNSYILSSGSRSGAVHHSDVRIAEHSVGILNCHTQEVTGLKWSFDGRYLASGGNDNQLLIWPSVGDQCFTTPNPLYTFNQHQAAVKALSWCPWQPGILASGGGTADRCIRMWNCNLGTCLSTTDTKSQVCAVLWSKEYKELISGHGFANNQLSIWKYPTMAKVTDLIGHKGRILHLAMSPDGVMVASAAADETLRIWKCFELDPQKKKSVASLSSKTSIMRQGIR